MGKKRIAVIGDVLSEEEQKKKRAIKRQQKALRQGKKVSPVLEKKVSASQTADTEEQPAPQPEPTPTPKPAAESTSARVRHPGRHGKKYQAAKAKVEPRPYPLTEAVKLLPQLAYARYTGGVELHLNLTPKHNFTTTTLELPYGTGKSKRVAVLDQQVLDQLEKGVIEFDILFAAPQQMKDLVKYAKLLGPRGLMPNPKTGTLTADPAKAAANYSDKQITVKAESKFPLIHVTVGRVDMEPEQLAANIEAVIKTVGIKNIKSAYLSASVSPSIQLEI